MLWISFQKHTKFIISFIFTRCTKCTYLLCLLEIIPIILPQPEILMQSYSYGIVPIVITQWIPITCFYRNHHCFHKQDIFTEFSSEIPSVKNDLLNNKIYFPSDYNYKISRGEEKGYHYEYTNVVSWANQEPPNNGVGINKFMRAKTWRLKNVEFISLSVLRNSNGLFIENFHTK